MDLVIDFALLVAVIVAVGEVIKKVKLLPVKYLPLVNIALGVIAGTFYLDGSLQTNILYGLIVGLSASGVFDMSKVGKAKKV